MDYNELLSAAQETYEEFSLVWRDEFDFNSECESFEASLKPYLLREERTSSWPGTEIFGALATVRFYKVTNGAIEVLRSIKSYKSFLSPDLPEDLAFYKSGKVIYGSIAHESDEWVIDNA